MASWSSAPGWKSNRAIAGPIKKELVCRERERRMPPAAMAMPILDPTAVHRPRNVDWKRAAALLYGDWGTRKAYVIGLAFAAAGFSSLPIILAVCLLTAVVAYN